MSETNFSFLFNQLVPYIPERLIASKTFSFHRSPEKGSPQNKFWEFFLKGLAKLPLHKKGKARVTEAEKAANFKVAQYLVLIYCKYLFGYLREFDIFAELTTMRGLSK